MKPVYKNPDSQYTIHQWCRDRLAAWSVPHSRQTLRVAEADVHVTYVGDRAAKVVYVPGTNLNAATSLGVAAALGRRWATMVVDLPGQPGLSSGERVPRPHDGWYGAVLNEVLEATDASDIILVGHSLGAAVALRCDSNRVAGRVLCSPAGVIPLSIDPVTAGRSLAWLLAPGTKTTKALFDRFTAPAAEASGSLVQWMSLVAKNCRSTFAPRPQPTEVLRRAAERPMVVATGAYDRFLPPTRLDPAVHGKFGQPLVVLPDVGHLVTDERPGAVAGLVDDVLMRV